jgi:hypothetical protein
VKRPDASRDLATVIHAARAASGDSATLDDVRAAMGAHAHVSASSRPSPAVRRAEAARVDAAAEPVVARELAPTLARPLRPRRARATRSEAFRTRAMERGAPGMAPLDWTPEDFATWRASHRSASSARAALATLPPVYARRVELAALAMTRREDGTRRPTRTWAHVQARRVVALAVTVFRASSPSRRRGMARKLVGRTRGMFATLAGINPSTGAPYSIGTFFHVNDARGPWDCGAMVALHRAGALWRHQPPAACVPEGYRGRDRDGNERAFNEYHLTERVLAPAELAPSAPVELAPSAPVELAPELARPPPG